MGPTVPGILPQVNEAEQPQLPIKPDAACPPFYNNTNMTKINFLQN